MFSRIFSFLAVVAIVGQGSISGAIGGRGGGHPVEAAFKDAAVKLSEYLINMPASVSKNLRFDARDLRVACEGIAPTCAIGDDLKFLRNQGKLAYVKEPKTGIILLDCAGGAAAEAQAKANTQLTAKSHRAVQVEAIPDVWATIFKLEDNHSRILIAHEILRTMGRSAEDQFYLSGSIPLAELEYDKKLFSLVKFGRNNKCFLNIDDSDDCRPNGEIAVSIQSIVYRVGEKETEQQLRNDSVTLYTTCSDKYGGDTYFLENAVDFKNGLENPNGDNGGSPFAGTLTQQIKQLGCLAD